MNMQSPDLTGSVGRLSRKFYAMSFETALGEIAEEAPVSAPDVQHPPCRWEHS